MKKLICYFTCFLLACSLVGCGDKKEEAAQEVQNVCKLEAEGQTMTNEIYSVDDTVTRVVYNIHTDAELLAAFTAEELEAIIAEAETNYSSIPGCDYVYSQDDKGIDEIITLTYTTESIQQLVDAGMITAASEGDDASDIQFVSLEATISQMTAEGFTCE